MDSDLFICPVSPLYGPVKPQEGSQLGAPAPAGLGQRKLCYNTNNMKDSLNFANQNNNDNDDNSRVVGRSLAG